MAAGGYKARKSAACSARRSPRWYARPGSALDPRKSRSGSTARMSASIAGSKRAAERQTMRTSRAFAAAIIVSVLAAPPARAAIELDPGMWQDTETGEQDGQPVKPEVTSDCMTPEEAKDPVKSLSVMKDTGGQCQKLEIKEKGNVVSVEMLCGDPKEMEINLTGTYTFLGRRHYTGTMNSTIILAGKKTTASK